MQAFVSHSAAQNNQGNLWDFKDDGFLEQTSSAFLIQMQSAKEVILKNETVCWKMLSFLLEMHRGVVSAD